MKPVSVWAFSLTLVVSVSSQVFHWGPCPTPMVQPNFDLNRVWKNVSALYFSNLTQSYCKLTHLFVVFNAVPGKVVRNWEAPSYLWERHMHRNQLLTQTWQDHQSGLYLDTVRELHWYYLDLGIRNRCVRSNSVISICYFVLFTVKEKWGPLREQPSCRTRENRLNSASVSHTVSI